MSTPRTTCVKNQQDEKNGIEIVRVVGRDVEEAEHSLRKTDKEARLGCT
jgi:hypothetical protein